MPATAGNVLASPEPFRLPRRALKRLLRVAGFCGNPSRFFGAVSAVPGGVETLENPPCFSGAVSAAPGGVEAAFVSCRLQRKPSSLLRSRFGVPGGALRRLLRGAGHRGKPSCFSGAFCGPRGRRGGFCELPATSETLLASPESFRRLGGR